MKKRINRLRLLTAILALISCILLIVYCATSVYPELSMVATSECANPVRNWNGKALGVRVGINYLDKFHRPSTHNIRNRESISVDRRALGSESGEEEEYQEKKAHNHNLIIWGTHHRVGTHLSQNMFSVICSRMKWCCVFHPTRDSIEAIQHSLKTEDVYVMGHNQWIWSPSELFDSEELSAVPYKFIHLYRNPINKIISGYEYHKNGVEAWTQKPKDYHSLCTSLPKHIKPEAPEEISRKSVVKYCRSLHLCETCCRREHEMPREHEMKMLPSSANANVQVLQTGHHRYEKRPMLEYEYICKTLGKASDGKNETLQNILLTAREDDGLAIEAALDYYENLRMINILDQTKNDPNTLNIDLDQLKNNFDSALWKILNHIHLDLTETGMRALVKDLQFFDLKTSTIYRWSMNNWWNRHTGAFAFGSSNDDQKRYKKALLDNASFKELYDPIMTKFWEFEKLYR